MELISLAYNFSNPVARVNLRQNQEGGRDTLPNWSSPTSQACCFPGHLYGVNANAKWEGCGASVRTQGFPLSFKLRIRN